MCPSGIGAGPVATSPRPVPGEGEPGARAARRLPTHWAARHAETVLVGFVAAIPVMTALIHAISAGWAPLGDDAIVAVRSLDVFSTHPPVLGMPAGGATGVLRQQAFHLGPMLFWLNAIPARLPWPSALPVTEGLVNVASVVGVVALARRRGGLALMYGTAAAIALMARSIPAEMLAAVWNPAAALLPFALLVFLSWSIACGDVRLSPLAVVTASFVMQCHLAYVVPAVGLLAVAAVGVGWDMRGTDGSKARRSLVVSCLVGLVCWSGPLLQQLTERPGNFVVLKRAGRASQPTLSIDMALHGAERAVGIVPWWLESPRSALIRIAELNTAPGLWTRISAAVLFAAVVGMIFRGMSRGRRDVVAGGAMGWCCARRWCSRSPPSRGLRSRRSATGCGGHPWLGSGRGFCLRGVWLHWATAAAARSPSPAARTDVPRVVRGRA